MISVHVGDRGTGIELDTGIDLAGAAACEILARLPDGTVEPWAATPDGTRLRGVIPDAAMARAGDIVLHAVVETGTGRWHGDPARLTVRPLFEEV